MTERARRSYPWMVAGVVAVVCAAAGVFDPAMAAGPQASAPVTAVSAQRAVLQKYCLSCHSQAMKQRGAVPIALDQLDLTRVARDAETWERIIRKVRTGLMPPARSPHPDK